MKAADRLLWWLFAGSMGGKNRARIVDLLIKGPCNLNQIAERLGMGYKTAQHHVRVLVENHMLESQGPHYGKFYFPSPFLEENLKVFEEIWKRIGKKGIRDESNGGMH
ncbi:MAG: winged helix-turn-helix transcriptional regulator [Euryarchaeota archaeon]|nr:winged helix-turn-helix transcriptional regulator [Euryarchaeota archaeon]